MTRVFICCENDADCNAPCTSHPWRRSRPSRDPAGFDRDGLPCGPTHERCTGCNAPPTQEHAIDCPMWSVKPRPLPGHERRVILAPDRFKPRNSEPTDLAD